MVEPLTNFIKKFSVNGAYTENLKVFRKSSPDFTQIPHCSL